MPLFGKKKVCQNGRTRPHQTSHQEQEQLDLIAECGQGYQRFFGLPGQVAVSSVCVVLLRGLVGGAMLDDARPRRTSLWQASALTNPLETPWRFRLMMMIQIDRSLFLLFSPHLVFSPSLFSKTGLLRDETVQTHSAMEIQMLSSLTGYPRAIALHSARTVPLILKTKGSLSKHIKYTEDHKVGDEVILYFT
jgi:hypothetical protein